MAHFDTLGEGHRLAAAGADVAFRDGTQIRIGECRNVTLEVHVQDMRVRLFAPAIQSVSAMSSWSATMGPAVKPTGPAKPTGALVHWVTCSGEARTLRRP